MPVTVSLLRLVALPNSRPLWPQEFEALVAKLEEKPKVKMQFGVIADWLNENDEPELADAFRWFSKQSSPYVILYAGDVNWQFGNMPKTVTEWVPTEFDRRTLAGLFAGLTVRLAEAREKLKKQAEELA